MENIPNKRCAVIASELHGISASSLQYITDRVNQLYTTAITNNHDVIVLGAWGCGAFKESDEDIDILVSVIRLCSERHAGNIKTVCAVIGRKNFNKFTGRRT